jgi:hypothetical protein
MSNLTLEQKRKIWAQGNPAPRIADGTDGCTRVSQDGEIIAKFYRDYLVARRDQADAQRFADSANLETLVSALESIKQSCYEFLTEEGTPDPAVFVDVMGRKANEALNSLNDEEVKS